MGINRVRGKCRIIGRWIRSDYQPLLDPRWPMQYGNVVADIRATVMMERAGGSGLPYRCPIGDDIAVRVSDAHLWPERTIAPINHGPVPDQVQLTLIFVIRTVRSAIMIKNSHEPPTSSKCRFCWLGTREP